jgi:hypothetical protein
MHRVYVLEQALTSASERFQLKFAKEAADALGDVDGVRPEPTGHGLVLHANNETALAQVELLLRARYGSHLRAGRVHVRLLDDPPMEPIMDVWVQVAAPFARSVQSDLRARRGRVLLAEDERRAWLIRAHVPMATLLGYAKDLRALAGERAEHWIVFNHWAPIGTDPAPAA